MTLIVPQDQITTKVIYGFNIQNVELVLFNSARINVELFDEHRNMIDFQVLTMSGQAYEDWGNNDEYVINFVATTLGFTIII